VYGVEFTNLIKSRVVGVDWDYLDLPKMCAQVAHEVQLPTPASHWDDLSPRSREEKESKAKRRLAKAFSHHSVAESIDSNNSDLLDELKHISNLLA
jgi:hypothetical protein